MDMNNIATAAGSVYQPIPAYSANTASKAKETGQSNEAAVGAVSATPAKKNTEAAVYEPGSQIYKPDTETIMQMKSDLEFRMQDLVRKMLNQQSEKYGSSLSMGDIFGKGGLVETGQLKVDPEMAAEARRNIAEDGYWGVEQTSDRLIKYAQALSGGDPKKLDTMIEAVKKGFKAAEKEWGGKMPDITAKTYDATMQKFEKLKQESSGITAAAGIGAA